MNGRKGLIKNPIKTLNHVLFAQLGNFRCFSNRAPENEREKRENFHFDWNPIAQKTFHRKPFWKSVLSLLMVRSFFFTSVASTETLPELKIKSPNNNNKLIEKPICWHSSEMELKTNPSPLHYVVVDVVYKESLRDLFRLHILFSASSSHASFGLVIWYWKTKKKKKAFNVHAIRSTHNCA